MRISEILRVCALLLICLQATASFSQEIGQESRARTLSPQSMTPTTPLTDALDKTQLEFYLRHLYIWPPEFRVEVGDYKASNIHSFLEIEVKFFSNLNSQLKVILVSEDGKHILDATPYQIDKNPFRANLDKINTLNSPGFGTQGAPVVIVVYSDFECSHCAREARILRTQLLDDYPNNVRVYYQDFPIPNHKWARAAAIAGQCLGDYSSDMYWEYFDWVFSIQRELNVKNFSKRLNSFAAERNVDTLTLHRCIESDRSADRLKVALDEGTRLGVRSTPTMFVNGRKIGSVGWLRLKRIIDNELTYQKVAQDAGDDCSCSLSPRIPGFE